MKQVFRDVCVTPAKKGECILFVTNKPQFGGNLVGICRANKAGNLDKDWYDDAKPGTYGGSFCKAEQPFSSQAVSVEAVGDCARFEVIKSGREGKCELGQMDNQLSDKGKSVAELKADVAGKVCGIRVYSNLTLALTLTLTLTLALTLTLTLTLTQD